MDWGAEFLLEYKLIADGFLSFFSNIEKKHAMRMANLSAHEQYFD